MALPEPYRKRLCTMNRVERLNREMRLREISHLTQLAGGCSQGRFEPICIMMEASPDPL